MVQIPALRLAMFLCHLGALLLPGCQSHGATLSSYYSAQGGVYEAFSFF